MTREPAPAALRILFVHPVALPVAEANIVQAAETARALAALGNEVFFVVPKLKAENATAALARVGVAPHERLFVVEEPAIRLKNSNRFSSIAVRAALLWYLRSLVRRGRTVILFRTLRDSRLARFLLTSGRLLKVPVVYEAHKLYAEKRVEQGFGADTLNRVERLERRALVKSDGVVASHPLLEAEVRRRFRPAAPMTTIPNGVPEIPPGPRERPIDVVYTGSLFPWKGVDQCVDAIARLPGRRLAVVGGHPKERLAELMQRAAALGVADRVTFAGQVDRPTALARLQDAKVALVPLAADSGEGERYTCPLKLLEAMMAGTPVVAADTDALRAFVTPGKDAVLVPPGDVAALASAIEGLLEDDARRAAIAASAREVALGMRYSARAARLQEFARSLL